MSYIVGTRSLDQHHGIEHRLCHSNRAIWSYGKCTGEFRAVNCWGEEALWSCKRKWGAIGDRIGWLYNVFVEPRTWQETSCSHDWTSADCESRVFLSKWTFDSECFVWQVDQVVGRVYRKVSDAACSNNHNHLFSFIVSLRSHVSPVYQVTFSADSRQLLSGSKDSTLKLWDLKTHKLKMDLPGHADEVYTVDWNPTRESRVASGGKDKMLRFWK